ncbi:DUF1799 domain-containing protein [Undibacterium sp.]|uniref:DUF1799 domain-containing protein n=1 Tax=Undibacterium sp. TaxID=1914977 RepID=UPI0037525855
MDKSAIASLKASGAPPEVIEAARNKSKPVDDVCDVWEENWESLLFFLDIANHWHVVTRGLDSTQYLGLNYTCIESIIRTFKPVKKNKRQALYRDLRIIELAALPVLNKQKKD